MKGSVLVVDDDPRLLNVVRIYLELKDYEVCTAVDGEQALARLAEASSDVVVMDVMLPGIDGIEVCRRLRARGDRTPMIVLTAAGSRGEEALAAGADLFATKPFSMEELEAEVASVLAEVAFRGTAAPVNVRETPVRSPSA